MASSSPKFMSNTDGLRVRSSKNFNVGLTCPAQAFPVPLTRYINGDQINFLFIQLKVSPVLAKC